MKNLIDIIQKYSLTVRCLPSVVITHSTYRPGDEEFCKKPSYDSHGNLRNVKRSVVTGYGTHPKDKKFLREERKIEKGGWWYVKETPHINSIVRFSRKYDKFFAQTLEEAIKLYLKAKNIN
jgi:hypothetical protein